MSKRVTNLALSVQAEKCFSFHLLKNFQRKNKYFRRVIWFTHAAFSSVGVAQRVRSRPDVPMTARTRWRPAGKWSEDVNIISSVQTSQDFLQLSPRSHRSIVFVPCVCFTSRNRGILTQPRVCFCAMFWKSVCAKRTINSWWAIWPAWAFKTYPRSLQKRVSTTLRKIHRVKFSDLSKRGCFARCLRWFPRGSAAVLIRAAEVEERFSRQSSFVDVLCPTLRP